MSIRKHSLYSLIGSVTPIAVSIITVPIYLSVIGIERYGVLAIVFVVLGYFGLFNFGIGSAVTARIGALSKATAAERSETMWAAILLSFGFALVGCAAMVPVSWFLFHGIVSIDPALQHEAETAVWWLIGAAPVIAISATFEGALLGREKFAALNAVRILGSVLMQIVPLSVALAIAPSLTLLLPAALGARLVTLALFGFLAIRATPVTRYRRPSYAVTRQILGFGGWVSVTNAVGPFLSTMDQILIARVMGAGFVPFYAVPQNILQRTSLLAQSVATALFPRLAAIDEPRARAILLNKSFAVIVAVITPPLIATTMFSRPLLELWLGAGFAEVATPVAILLIPGLWANSIARIYFTALQATGRPDLVAKAHLLELFPYLALLAILLTEFQLPGVAAAWSLRAMADMCLLMKFSRVYPERPVLILAAPMALLGAATLVTLSGQSLTTPVLVGDSVLLAAAAGWAFRVFPKDALVGLSIRPRRRSR